MKSTLGSKYGAVVEPFLAAGIMRPEDYRPAINSLYTDAVASSIRSLGKNHLLGASPLLINEAETALSRHERCTLAQLRSGDCILLKDYQMRYWYER